MPWFKVTFMVEADDEESFNADLDEDKIAAAVYVDAVDADAAKLDAASLELLVFTTGLLIDTAASRKKTPSPSLNDAESVTAQQRAAAPAPPPAPRPTPPPPPARPSPPVADESADTTVDVSAAQLREMMAPPPAKPAFTMPETDFAAPSAATPSAASFMTTAIPAVEAPRPAPPPPPPHEREERASTQYIPPPNLSTRGGAPISGARPSDDDSKRHDEARRLRINISDTLERRLRTMVRAELEQRWLDANKIAIDAYNLRVSRDGLLADEAGLL